MAQLWKSTDFRAWDDALAQYDDAVRASGKEWKLVAMEKWYLDELPRNISSRSPPHFSKDDFIKLVDWKLTRGQWRPKLLDFAKQQDGQEVESTTKAALSAMVGCTSGSMNPLKAAIEKLSQLKGTGTATASAVIAATCPHAPFMSDEALSAVMGKRDYTTKTYMEFAEKMQRKAKELNSSRSQQGPELESVANSHPSATAAPAAQQQVQQAQQPASFSGSRECSVGDAAGEVAAAGNGPSSSRISAGGVRDACGQVTWTAVLIERALFAAAVLGLPKGSDAPASDGVPDGGGTEGDDIVFQPPTQGETKKRRQQ